MDTIFLATVIGWYMVIFGLLMLIRHDYVKAAMTDILAQPGVYFVLALITVVLGLLIVASHNLWTTSWPVAITLFGWVLFIGGLFRLFFSEAVHKMWKECLKIQMKLKIMGVLFLIFGVYLLIHVYHFHHIAKMVF